MKSRERERERERERVRGPLKSNTVPYILT